MTVQLFRTGIQFNGHPELQLFLVVVTIIAIVAALLFYVSKLWSKAVYVDDLVAARDMAQL